MARFQVLPGAEKDEVIQNEAVKEISFNFKLPCRVVDEPVKRSDVDLLKVRTTVVLHQAGKEITIYNGSLYPMAMYSTYGQGEAFTINASGDPELLNIVRGAGVKHVAILSVRIPLGNHEGEGIILKGSDKLVISTNLQTDCFGSNLENASLMVETVTGVLNQFSIPQYRLFNVDKNRNVFERTLGDNVQRIMFVSCKPETDTPNTYAQRPFNEVRLVTDRKNVKSYWEDYVLKRLRDFDSNDTPMGNTFLLENEGELDRVALEIDVETPNIVEGKHFILVKSFIIDNDVFTRAVNRKNKHLSQATAKARKALS